jgi:hypothetical protein
VGVHVFNHDVDAVPGREFGKAAAAWPSAGGSPVPIMTTPPPKAIPACMTVPSGAAYACRSSKSNASSASHRSAAAASL